MIPFLSPSDVALRLVAICDYPCFGELRFDGFRWLAIERDDCYEAYEAAEASSISRYEY